MNSVWSTIQGDLDGLAEQAKSHPEKIPTVTAEKVAISNMMDAWNELGDYGASI